jgi:hypothetical protein
MDGFFAARSDEFNGNKASLPPAIGLPFAFGVGTKTASPTNRSDNYKNINEGMMKKLLLAAAILVVHTGALNATSIPINLGPTRVTPFFGTSFNELNGVSLNGQSLSLNFVFTDNFVRLLPPGSFPHTGQDFDIALILDTNANRLPGFASGSGFIFDQAGNQLQPAERLGSAASSGGAIVLGLFPLSDGASPDANFSGFHVNITLPDNPGFEIIDEHLELWGGHIHGFPSDEGQFGIGPHVADNGSTLALFAFALLAVSATTKLRVRT